MNRTLRRPMFRIGGVAEGITSGLSRQGYAGVDKEIAKKKWQYNKRALEAKYGTFDNYLSALNEINSQRVLPADTTNKANTSDFSKMKVSALGDMNLGQLQELSKSMSYKPKSDPWDYLGEVALNLVSTPTSGNIVGDIGTSMKEPYSRYLDRKQSAAEQRYGSQADMFKTMMGGAFEVMAAKEEAKGEGKNWLEQWKFDQIPVLNKTISKLTKKQDDGTITADEELDLQNAIDQKGRIVSISPVLEAFLKTKRGGWMVTDEMDRLLLEDRKLPKEERKYKGDRDPQLAIDAIASVEARLKMAEGGRVGYQAGNSVMPGQPMQASMPMNQGAGTMDQGEQVPEELQNIDYDTLRARLPASITDDIVRLIASSAEAMEDFATIQTQQDINNFNQKYGVELVLPAEA